MTGVSIVFVTVGNADEASVMARKLVEERTVACVNIVPNIRSIYRWKGEIHDDEEYLLVMKTRSSLVATLKATVREIHSYEVPEVVAFSVEDGLPDYLEWVMDSTKHIDAE